MDDILIKIKASNKIRNYWDIQREVIECIDPNKYNIEDDDFIAICEAIRYGIKMAHNHGYERGYQLARRKQIEETFADTLPISINENISPNKLRELAGCKKVE